MLRQREHLGALEPVGEALVLLEFKDTDTDILREVIEAKVEGKEVVTPETPKQPRVANLMEALQKSLRERPLAKADGRKATASKRSRAGRRKAG